MIQYLHHPKQPITCHTTAEIVKPCCFFLKSSTGTFAVNAVIVIALGVAWDLVKQKEPPQTGFFCHDATLSKPYVPARVRKLHL